MKTIGLLLVVALALVGLTPAAGAASLPAPKSVSIAFSGSRYVVNWTAVSGATKYDVEFHPYTSSGQPEYGPFVPHWVITNNWTGATSSLPTGEFSTVVYTYGNAATPSSQPKTVPKGATVVHNQAEVQAALTKCRKSSVWSFLGGLAAGTLAVVTTIGTGGTAAAVWATAFAAGGSGAIAGGVAYVTCG